MFKRVWKLFFSACPRGRIHTFTLFSKRRRHVSPFCGSHHLVFIFWLISIALFRETLIHVMLQRNCQESGHCSNVWMLLQQLWTFTQNGLCWTRSYCFFPKEGCSSFNVLYYYLCVGQCNFSLWAAPSKSVLEGVKAIFLTCPKEDLFWCLDIHWHLFWSKAGWSWTCWTFNKGPYCLFSYFFHVLIFKFDWLILM